MNVIKVTPQGYCYGVVRAIDIVKKSVKTEPQPVYVLGDIVHNKLISQALKNINIITIEANKTKRLDLLDEINEGTVIFTAHGVSPLVINKAISKGLNIVDATCPEVNKTQDDIKKYLEMEYKIIFIGKAHHPEAEACIDIDRDNTIFISNIDDIKKHSFEHNKYFIAYQSTLNTEDTKAISNQLEEVLDGKIYTNQHKVCDATFSRQQAVKNLKDVDFLIVVGDENSNNSNKLVEIANVKAKRILSVSELNLEEFKNYSTVAITSGASTPTQLTKHIISFFEQFDYDNKETWHYTEFDIAKII